MGEYTEECINTFLMNQGQLFDEPVAENYDEAEAFLEDCFAVVADNLDDVRAYMEEEGMDVEEMSDAELEEQSEVFALPDGSRSNVLFRSSAPSDPVFLSAVHRHRKYLTGLRR